MALYAHTSIHAEGQYFVWHVGEPIPPVFKTHGDCDLIQVDGDELHFIQTRFPDTPRFAVTILTGPFAQLVWKNLVMNYGE